MPTAKDHSKAQPMSISQLCQQDSDNDIHSIHDLDQDPLDINNSGDESDSHYQSYRRHRQQALYNNQNGYSEASDMEDSTYHHQQQQHHHRAMAGNNSQPDSAEQLAAEALGDMANASRADASSYPAPAGPFMSRMSSLPLVNSAMSSALKAYENTKQNSKVMKVAILVGHTSMLGSSIGLSWLHSNAVVITNCNYNIVWCGDGRIKRQVTVKAGL
jgi:hypothetical protein